MPGGDVRWYLFARVCPILCISKDDIEFCFENFGRTETLDCLTTLIIENYDFPYERFPGKPPPSYLPSARLECKAPQAASKVRLGGYRCSRISPENPSSVVIPGITLILHDTTTTADWFLDTFMEEQRMKCWVAVQGKPKRWNSASGDDRNELRSPYSRVTNPKTLIKILEELILANKVIITHDAIRDCVLNRAEAKPPNTELYLQTITKLKPATISIARTTYGVGLAAIAYAAASENNTQCSFDLEDVEPKAAKRFREFLGSLRLSDPTLLQERQGGIDKNSSLIFMDAIPYGTHDLRAYLGEHSIPRYLTYREHLRKYFIKPLRKILDEVLPSDRSPCLALIVSLRELPAQPTIEPILLAIMSDDRFSREMRVVGALVSKQRDYAAFLISINPKSSQQQQNTEWKSLFTKLYPELVNLLSLSDEDDHLPPPPLPAVALKSRSSASSSANTLLPSWETTCLSGIDFSTIKISEIPFQGPRSSKNPIFPTRTRLSKIIEEKINPETGDVLFTFGETSEPSSSSSTPVVVANETQDPLLQKMITGIKANMLRSSHH